MPAIAVRLAWMAGSNVASSSGWTGSPRPARATSSATRSSAASVAPAVARRASAACATDGRAALSTSGGRRGSGRSGGGAPNGTGPGAARAVAPFRRRHPARPTSVLVDAPGVAHGSHGGKGPRHHSPAGNDGGSCRPPHAAGDGLGAAVVRSACVADASGACVSFARLSRHPWSLHHPCLPAPGVVWAPPAVVVGSPRATPSPTR